MYRFISYMWALESSLRPGFCPGAVVHIEVEGRREPVEESGLKVLRDN